MFRNTQSNHHTHLYTGSSLQFTEAADERPAGGGDVRHLGDGLHPLWTRDAHLEIYGTVSQPEIHGTVPSVS